MAAVSSMPQLGSVETQKDGRTTVSVKVMGIDGADIAKKTQEAYEIKAKRYETQISKNSEKLAALNELETKAGTLKKAIDSLRNPDFKMASSSIFDQRVAMYGSRSLNGTTPSSPGSILSVSVPTGVVQPDFVVTVNNLASQDQTVSRLGAASSTTALIPANPGVLTINSVNIPLTEGMNLNDIRSAINVLSDRTQVIAGVETQSDGRSYLRLQATTTGTPIQISEASNIQGVLDLTSITSSIPTGKGPIDPIIPANPGIFTINGTTIPLTENMSLDNIRDAINATPGINAVATTITENEVSYLRLTSTNGQNITIAEDKNIQEVLNLTAHSVDTLSASYSLNGSSLTSTTNQITNAISGVSLNLLGADPNTQVSVSIKPNLEGTQKAINTFIDAYNDFTQFLTKHGTWSLQDDIDKQPSLYTSATRKELLTELPASINSYVTGGDPKFATLDSLGITSNRDVIDKLGAAAESRYNIGIKNQNTLSNALLTSFSSIQRLFEFEETFSNHNFHLYQRPNMNNTGSILNQPVTIVLSQDTSSNYSATFKLSAKDKITSVTGIADAGAALIPANPGSLTINSVNIPLTEGMTLNEVVNSINNLSGTSKAVATLETHADGRTYISLDSLTANPLQITETPDIQAVLDLASTTTPTGVADPTAALIPANPGSFTINGTTIPLVAGMSLNDVRDTINGAIPPNVTAAVVTEGRQSSLKLTSTNGRTITITQDSNIQSVLNLSAPATSYTALITNAEGKTYTPPASPYIMGPPDSPFKGMFFNYLGTGLAPGGSVTTTFTATQGIGDKINDTLKDILDPDNGFIADEKKQLSATSHDAQEKVDKIKKSAEAKAEALRQKFGKLQELYAKFEDIQKRFDSYFENNSK